MTNEITPDTPDGKVNAALIKIFKAPGQSLMEAKKEWDALSEADKADLRQSLRAHPEQMAS